MAISIDKAGVEVRNLSSNGISISLDPNKRSLLIKRVFIKKVCLILGHKLLTRIGKLIF